MPKAGSESDSAPSEALIRIFEYVPAWSFVGVPEGLPEFGSKLAQPGLFWILKLSGSLSGSEACGVNA